MKTTNILITGGAGNVAGSLARRLVQNPQNKVVIVDNLLTGTADRLPDKAYDNWTFIKADVNRFEDMSPIFGRYDIEYVFHYAAVVGVKRTLENPMLVFRDIDGLKNMLDLSKNTGVKRIFFSSSSEVYGEPVEFPQNEETTPLNSRLPYAIVKNLAESMMKAWHQEYGLNQTIFRFFNTYGPLQSEDFVLPRFLKAAMRGENITIYGEGSQTRTFCFVDDNLDTVEKILTHDLCFNEVINIGHHQEITILDLAKLVIERTNSSSVIQFLPPLAEGDMTRRCPDNSKMREILGRDLVSLEAGIDKMLAFYGKRF